MRHRASGSWHRLALCVCCLFLALPANANWLTTIIRQAAEGAGKAGRHDPGGLPVAGRLINHIERLPVDARRSAVAAVALPEGHWRLTNAAGETVTAATPGEMTAALRVLMPGVADNTAGRFTFYVDEETVFRRQDAVAALPEPIDVRLAHGERTHAVLRGEGQLHAVLERGLVVALDDAGAFAEAAWQLARSINKGGIRILSLDSGGSQQLARTPPRDAASGLPLPETVDPGGLGWALSGLSGQTVVITGKVEGTLLRYAAASGPERTADIADLLAAAEKADVNLILLQADKALQPGVRNTFWQQTEVGGLGEALRGASLGDFLAALCGGKRTMLVRAMPDTYGRTRVSIVPAPSGIGLAIDEPAGTLDSMTGLMTEIAAGLMGRIASSSIEISARSRERQQELDARIVPGIPAALQLGYVVLIGIGVMGLPVALGWWRRLLPLRPRAAFGSGVALRLDRAWRIPAFSLLFLPLVALPAFLVNAMLQAGQILGLVLRALTAPFRWLFRRSRAT